MINVENNFKKKDLIKFIILITFLLSISILGIIYYPKIKELVNFDNIKDFVNNNKGFSVFAFIILQIIQVVIFIIPGDVINATGGFVFNIYVGAILSFIGVVLGSIIAFCISRYLGYNFINRFIKKEKLDKLVNFMESNTGFISLFIFCNLPFVPKDVLMYAAGLTPLNGKKTLTIYCLSRIPGIIIWTSMGANIYNRSIIGIVITLTILMIFLISIVLVKNKIFKNRIIKVKK